MACGQQQSESCAVMLACDAAWAAVDDRRDVDWQDEDPTYGTRGACWSDKDSVAACTAACDDTLVGYRDALQILEDEGEFPMPTACD